MLAAGLVLGASAMAQTVVINDRPHDRAVRHEVRQDLRHDRFRMQQLRRQERMRMMRERERMRMMRHHRHHRDVVVVR